MNEQRKEHSYVFRSVLDLERQLHPHGELPRVILTVARLLHQAAERVKEHRRGVRADYQIRKQTGEARHSLHSTLVGQVALLPILVHIRDDLVEQTANELL